MGIVSTIFGVFGFGFGASIGLVIGYFMFIYTQPTDVKVSFPSPASLFTWFYVFTFDLYEDYLCLKFFHIFYFILFFCAACYLFFDTTVEFDNVGIADGFAILVSISLYWFEGRVKFQHFFWEIVVNLSPFKKKKEREIWTEVQEQ